MGLGALFDDNSSDIQVKKTLRVSEIEPNRLQPRKNFNEEAIASLAESVKERFPDFVETFVHKRNIRDKTHLHLRKFLTEGLK